MGHYTVTVTREDDLWVAVARRDGGDVVTALDFDDFDDLHVTMPEAIADMTDDEDVAVEWRYEVAGRDVTEQMRRMIDTTERLTQVQADQENARRAALEALHEAGLSQRTIADALGVSHQRVNQLLKAG